VQKFACIAEIATKVTVVTFLCHPV